MEFQPSRGTNDLIPPMADWMLGLYESAHKVANLYGYRYLETPTFEMTSLFSRTSGDTSDIVTKEMYSFEDRGKRSLTLRPEGTAGVMRAYLGHQHHLASPFRAYYVSSFFRHGRPQSGRTREFRQFGVEVIGDGGPVSDQEVIELAATFLKDRGLQNLTLRLNSIGDEVCRPAYRDALVSYFLPYLDQLDGDCQARLQSNPLRILDCKVDGKKPFVQSAPSILNFLCENCRGHFESVQAGLKSSGIEFVVSPRLVRGLDYYIRTAFEFVSGDLSPSQATVCGGGRYDGLSELLGGPSLPGVGFGLGLDRVLLAMKEASVTMPSTLAPTAFVASANYQDREFARSTMRTLRDAGVSATWSYDNRTLRSQMKMASRLGVAFVVIVGQELTQGLVTLRRLVDGVQKTVPAADVVSWLTRLDGWTE